MDFQKVTYDSDLDEIEEPSELRNLVRKFEEAQDENISEFEQASEEIDDLEGRVAEVQEFDSELTEELAEVSPLDEDELAEFTISRKRSLLADFSDEEDEGDEGDDGDDGDDGGDGEGGADFDDMGRRGETHNEEEAKQDFADDYLGDIPGLNY